MKRKSMITDYIERHEKQLRLVQGLVPEDLVLDVRDLMDKDGITWNDLLTASLKKYRDEKLKENT